MIVEQVAAIAEMVTDPEMESVIQARTIIGTLDSLAATLFCVTLPTLSQQSHLQHKQYSYLVPLFSELQAKIAEYVFKFKSIKMKRASLEYPNIFFYYK